MAALAWPPAHHTEKNSGPEACHLAAALVDGDSDVQRMFPLKIGKWEAGLSTFIFFFSF